MKRLYGIKWGFLIAVCCFTFLLVSPGDAIWEPATLIVDNVNPTSNCVDGGPAYTTIEDARKAAAYGDTIKVCRGTYEENVPLTDGDFTIQSVYGPEVTKVVNPNGIVFSESGSAESLVSGFTITGGTGIFGTGCPTSTFSSNIITLNDYGVWQGDLSIVLIKDNIIKSNIVGIYSESGVEIYHNNIINNDTQISGCNNSNVHHNYWSDYTGVDLDGDGIGDTEIPHHCDNYPYIDPLPDFDGDYVFDLDDNCPYTWNLDKADADGDGFGTVCDCDDANPAVPTNLPVRILRTLYEYDTLQEAYNDIETVDGDTIQSQAAHFIENLSINLNKSVTLEGGYDCDYNYPPTGKTTLIGTMTISNGTLTIGDGIFVLDGNMIITDGTLTIGDGTFVLE